MKCKKIITLIIATMLILLPMMTTQVKAVVGKVYNLETKQSDRGVNFTWSQVLGADGYNIYINTSNKGYEFIGSAKSCKVSIIGFKSTETYKAKVCAYELKNGEKIEGAFSQEVVVNYTTKTEEVKVLKVENLNISQSGDYISLSWTKVPNATGYEIDIGIPGFGYMNIGTAFSNNVFIKGGKIGQTYELRVRAYNNANGATVYGDYSDSKSITLKDEAQEEIIINKVSKVENVTVKNISENGAYITWNKASNATGYEIWLAKGSKKYSNILNTSKTYANISGLDSNTNYRVIIVAYNDSGKNKIYASDSSVVSFNTTAGVKLEQVKNLKTTVKNNSVTLSWNKVSNADGYDIYLAKGNGSFKYNKSTINGSITLNDLEYDTTYRVKVRAFKNVNGKEITSDYSIIKTFKTEKYINIGQVKNVSYYVIKDTVVLTWDKVSNVNGYEIEFTVPGIGGVTKLYTNTNSRVISGLTEKQYKYTARIRAYKIVNGMYEYGQYSEIQEFSGK